MRVKYGHILGLVLSVKAWAQPVPERSEPELPKEVGVALLIREGQSVRTHPSMVRLAEALRRSGWLGDKVEAWSLLAKTLGLEDGAALDLLMGQRFAAVWSAEPAAAKLPGGPSRAWAAISEVPAGDADLLAARLDPAPRGVSNRRAIMLLEGGQFVLSRRDVGDRSTLTLTPAASPLEPGVASRAAEELGKSLAGAGLGVYASWEREGRPGETERVWATATPNGAVWTIEARGTPGLFALTPDGLRSLSRGERREPMRAASHLLHFEGAIPRESQWDESLKQALTAMSLLRLPVPDPRIWGPRMLISVERGGELGKELSMTLGVEVSDVRAAATQGDAMMSAIVEWAGRLALAEAPATTKPGPKQAVAEQIKLAGREYAALRVVSLSPPSKKEEDGVILAWTCVGSDAAGDSRGWWVLRFEGSASGRGRLEESLAGVGRDLRGAVGSSTLMRLRVRPAELYEWLDLKNAPEAETLAPLREIDQVEFEAWADPSGHIVGHGTVQLGERPRNEGEDK